MDVTLNKNESVYFLLTHVLKVSLSSQNEIILKQMHTIINLGVQLFCFLFWGRLQTDGEQPRGKLERANR